MHKLIITLLLLASAAFSQPIENGWKGILPLVTSKSEVNRLLGEHTIDKNGYFRYRTDLAFIEVNYTVSPCSADDFGRGSFSVPEGTVLGYTVVLKEMVELTKLQYSADDFRRDDSSDLVNSVEYRNTDAGVTIGVGIYPIKGLDRKYQDIEYAGLLRYAPSKENKKKFQCIGIK